MGPSPAEEQGGHGLGRGDADLRQPRLGPRVAHGGRDARTSAGCRLPGSGRLCSWVVLVGVTTEDTAGGTPATSFGGTRAARGRRMMATTMIHGLKATPPLYERGRRVGRRRLPSPPWSHPARHLLVPLSFVATCLARLPQATQLWSVLRRVLAALRSGCVEDASASARSQVPPVLGRVVGSGGYSRHRRRLSVPRTGRTASKCPGEVSQPGPMSVESCHPSPWAQEEGRRAWEEVGPGPHLCWRTVPAPHPRLPDPARNRALPEAPGYRERTGPGCALNRRAASLKKTRGCSGRRRP